ncbi:MAG: xanthine dehydrogenase family protein molybdopterin-binding subunit [Armatimonadetes bacterium]|nr:xanthine dehydrogenase family protein molybdopterin-binding subunit [Armatimonadota bacterium]
MPRLVRTKIEFEGRIEERDIVIEGDDIPAWGADASLELVGRPVPRVDGRERAGGTATYTHDVVLPGMLHGAILRCPHAHARIRAIDTSRAESLPGVRAVLSGANAPTIKWYQGRSFLFDSDLRFPGDEVAAVAADSAAVAGEALNLIEVDYEVLPALLDPEEALKPGAIQVFPTGNLIEGGPDLYARGNVEAGFAQADVVVEGTFRTQGVVHHSLETHGSVAAWGGDGLTIWDSTQHIFGVRRQVAQCLGVPLDRVRVISHFMGGGFGSKNRAGKYTVIAALLARATGRPVRVVLSRHEESVATGLRPASVQRLRIGARRDGTLVAIDLWGVSNGGAYRDMRTPLGGPAKELFRCPNVRTEVYTVYTHTGTAAAFRAPGFTEGTFALESLLDALAEKLNVDPLELRVRNHVGHDQVLNRQYTAKHLLECYRAGAAAMGWERRKSLPGTGTRRRGLGMASQIWGGGGGPPAYARVRLNADGTAEVVAGTQDIGTGARTALAQIAAEALGLPLDRVTFHLGDTEYPYAPLSAGSQTIASVGPAVRMAATEARHHLLEVAGTMLEALPEDLTITNGRIHVRGVPERSVAVAEVTGKLNNFTIEGRGFRAPNPDGATIRTFGAQFAEVEVDVETGEVRVLRVVAVHDVGRIINPQQYASQIQGGIIQGLGLALLEDQVVDPETGAVLTLGFDTYALPKMEQIPAIDVLTLDAVDAAANNLGAKGAGEPPIIPTAAAIANAVSHAVGARVTALPLTPPRVLAALGEARSSGRGLGSGAGAP